MPAFTSTKCTAEYEAIEAADSSAFEMAQLAANCKAVDAA